MNSGAKLHDILCWKRFSSGLCFATNECLLLFSLLLENITWKLESIKYATDRVTFKMGINASYVRNFKES